MNRTRIAGFYPMTPATIFLLIAVMTGCFEPVPEIMVRPSLEDLNEDGGPFTPATQSFLRGEHLMETIKSLAIHGEKTERTTIVFSSSERQFKLALKNFPMDFLVPRLHYAIDGEADEFDAFNLMLAEYSRVSLSVPVGKKGDTMAYFRTNLLETAPWSLEGDYRFKPNPRVRPGRIGLINNCLTPGLWEISASDRSGELYHGWFDMPLDYYLGLVAEVNGVSPTFAARACAWRDEGAPLVLERLRTPVKSFGPVSLSLYREDSARGFSSQDSRRKIAKGFARVPGTGHWRAPKQLSELTDQTCRLTEFVAPGKYKKDGYREFDLRFLRKVKGAEVMAVKPATSYDPPTDPLPVFDYVEIRLYLDAYLLIIGNLPLQLMVPQEDFVLHGFGVGVLSSGGLAERRKLLIKEGPAPSFAYLAVAVEGGWRAVNSHGFGLEQVFIRTHLGEKPWWEITLTSYERIVDLIKYKVEIPEQLRESAKKHAMRYISPTYFTYRDDNLR